MKKALSLILSLVMVLTLIPMAALPAFAEGEEASVSTDNVIEVYNTLAEGEASDTKVTFESLIGTTLTVGKTYKLMEDIDLSHRTLGSSYFRFPTGTATTTLDGNGHTVHGIHVSGSNHGTLFHVDTENTKAYISIKNISFGSKDKPVTFTHTGSGTNDEKGLSLFWSTGGQTNITFDNVHTYVNAEYTPNCWQQQAVLIVRNWGTTTFTNCTIDGTISKVNGMVGTFVGEVRGGTVTFENCVNDLDFVNVSTQTYGGFVGYVTQSGKVNINNCVNNGDISGTVRKGGGFIGEYYGTGTIQINNSINNGNITSTSANDNNYAMGLGGLIGTVGRFVNTTGDKGSDSIVLGTIVIDDCINKGDITGIPVAGGLVGNMAFAGASVTVTDSANEGTVKVTGGHAGGAIGKADITSGKITVSRFFGTGYVESTSSAGGIIGRTEATGNTGMEVSISDSVVTGTVKGKWNAGGATGYLASAKTTLKNNISTATVLVDNVTSTSQNQCVFVNISGSAVQTYENNYYLNECEMDATGATKVTLDEIVDLINAKTEFVGNFGKFASNSEGTNIVVATPAYAGYQMGEIDENNKYTVRFLATINDVKLADPCEYTVLGMEFSFDGGETFVKYTNVANVYTSVIATEDGAQTAVTAEKLGGKYIFAVIGTGFDATKSLNMVVRTYAEGADGVRYYGDKYAVSLPVMVEAE